MSYVSVSDSDTVWAAGGGCQVAPGPSRASLAAGTVSVAQLVIGWPGALLGPLAILRLGRSSRMLVTDLGRDSEAQPHSRAGQSGDYARSSDRVTVLRLSSGRDVE